MFASSLSSAARQPKGRGYSRKQLRIENGGRGEYRPRPSCVNRTPASQKFRFPETQLSSPLIPPPKARECLQSPVASIRRRLPPTDHVRFTSRAGKCIGMLAFFSSPPSFPPFSPSPRSIPLEEIVGRGETRRANRIPDAGTGGNVGYVGRETKLIDAVKRAGAGQRISNHRCTTVPVAPVPKWQWENFRPILGTGRMPIKYRYGCVSVYTVGERIES